MTQIYYKFIGDGDRCHSNEIQDVIGQHDVIKKLNFYIKAHDHGQCFPTTLFSGSHGLGKTYIAGKLAKSLNRRYLEVNCSSVKSVDDFITLATKKISGDKGITILLDESHGLNSEVTNMLLTILNPSSSMINNYAHDGTIYIFDLNKMNFIFGTTDAHEMFAPLKNRCEQVYFHPYDDVSILEMLKMYNTGISFECDLEELVHACRGRGRDTFVLSQNLSRHLLGLKVLDEQLWEDFKFIFNIYPLGLKKEELNLLKAIKHYGPISCANLALKLMVNQKNIKEELEVRLQEVGLITSSTRGRVVTERGIKYLNELKE
jgi:Holliday junction DNA helicase RuvB